MPLCFKLVTATKVRTSRLLLQKFLYKSRTDAGYLNMMITKMSAEHELGEMTRERTYVPLNSVAGPQIVL
jgi:hypothetical protein